MIGLLRQRGLRTIPVFLLLLVVASASTGAPRQLFGVSKSSRSLLQSNVQSTDIGDLTTGTSGSFTQSTISPPPPPPSPSPSPPPPSSSPPPPSPSQSPPPANASPPPPLKQPPSPAPPMATANLHTPTPAPAPGPSGALRLAPSAAPVTRPATPATPVARAPGAAPVGPVGGPAVVPEVLGANNAAEGPTGGSNGVGFKTTDCPALGALNITGTQYPCQTLGQALGSSPSLSNWAGMLQAAGLGGILDSGNSITMFAPINSAFNCSQYEDNIKGLKIPAGLYVNVSGTVFKTPTAQQVLAAGQIVTGSWSPNTLGGGVQFSSGNFNMNGQNAETVLVTVDAISSGNDTRLDGMGSTADVVYDDIVTCSNTIIYPISNFLLPVAST